MQLKYIMEKLSAKGFKNTPQRRAIIKAILELDKRPTAREIHAEVGKEFPEISLDTVYRNLYLLVDMGIVDQLNLRFKDSSRFELSTTPHHHHLVCVKCGKTVCLESCPFENYSLTQGEVNNFEVLGHAFEIYGYCSQCKEVM